MREQKKRWGKREGVWGRDEICPGWLTHPLPATLLTYSTLSPQCVLGHLYTLLSFLCQALLCPCSSVGWGGPEAVWALTCPLFTHTQMYTHTNTEKLMCKTHYDPACWWWKAGSEAPVLMPEGKTWEKPHCFLIILLLCLYHCWTCLNFSKYLISVLFSSLTFNGIYRFPFYWILADTSQQQVSSWGLQLIVRKWLENSYFIAAYDW